MRFSRLKGFVLANIFICLVGCKLFSTRSNLKSVDEDLWLKRQWMQKASRMLRLGKELTGKELEILSFKTREEIADFLIGTPEFPNAAFEFFTYYYGFKKNQEKTLDTEEFSALAQEFPAAYHAAFQLSVNRESWTIPEQNGNFLTLYDYRQPVFVTDLVNSFQTSQLKGAINNEFDPLISMLKDPKITIEEACAWEEKEDKRGDDDEGNDFESRVEEILRNAITGIDIGRVVDTKSPPIGLECVHANVNKSERLKNLQFELNAIMETIDFVGRSRTKPFRSSFHIENSVYVTIPSFKPEYDFLGDDMWEEGLKNTSTNFNRKRGAWVLRNFLCDDLTPLDLAFDKPEASAMAHTKNRHASDAGCQACHYKLDPMAGFFRYAALQGGNAEMVPQGGISGGFFQRNGFAAPNIVSFIFDDLKFLGPEEYRDYQKNWRFRGEPGDGAEVGYIKSTTDRSINFYAKPSKEPLRELFTYLRNAPEVRSCLVERAADYFINPNQAFDGEWLAEVTSEMNADIQRWPTRSAYAFKKMLKRLVLSNTFLPTRKQDDGSWVALDPDESQCYDFAKNQPSDDGMDCQISYALRKHCVRCHNNHHAENGLDLSKWVKIPGGMGFKHEQDGKQLTRSESFVRIATALSTKDASKLMPMSGNLPAPERAKLYKWFETNKDVSTNESL